MEPYAIDSLEVVRVYVVVMLTEEKVQPEKSFGVKGQYLL